MKGAAKLFSREQRERIVAAIGEAEKATSAEIRVHIENHCAQDPLDRAVAVFVDLKMDQTEGRNGVLVYLAAKDHKTAIIGDININKHVHHDFWHVCYADMKQYFAVGDFTGGIVRAIEMIRDELAGHFPWQADDVNELPDDISFGKN